MERVLHAAIGYIKDRRDDVGEVLSWRLYPDRIAVVIYPGYKYVIGLDELNLPDPEATSAAAALATEHNLNLTTIVGTGKDGRILVSDVQEAIDAREAF